MYNKLNNWLLYGREDKFFKFKFLFIQFTDEVLITYRNMYVCSKSNFNFTRDKGYQKRCLNH